MPSPSSVRSVCASIFSLMPSTSLRSSPHRRPDSDKATSSRTPHLLVTWSSTVRVGQAAARTPSVWRRCRTLTWLLTDTCVPYREVGIADREGTPRRAGCCQRQQHSLLEEPLMSVVVTGATGHLGRLVVEHLLADGVPADQI